MTVSPRNAQELEDAEAPFSSTNDTRQSLQRIAELEATVRDFERREMRLSRALHAGRMGTWEWEVKKSRVSWSSTLEAIHGIPVGSFAGTFEAYQSDIHPEDRERVLESIQSIGKDGDPGHFLQ